MTFVTAGVESPSKTETQAAWSEVNVAPVKRTLESIRGARRVQRLYRAQSCVLRLLSAALNSGAEEAWEGLIMTGGDVADTKGIDDGERALPKRAGPKRLGFDALSAAMGTIDYRVINWFNNGFGFGFITPDSDDVDVLVHISQILGDGTPEIGQRVSYRLAGTPRRPEAKTVNRL